MKTAIEQATCVPEVVEVNALEIKRNIIEVNLVIETGGKVFSVNRELVLKVGDWHFRQVILYVFEDQFPQLVLPQSVHLARAIYKLECVTGV